VAKEHGIDGVEINNPTAILGCEVRQAGARPLYALVERNGGISDVRGYVCRLGRYVKENGILYDHLEVNGYEVVGELVIVHADGLRLTSQIVVDARGGESRLSHLLQVRTIPFTRFACELAPIIPVIAYEAGTYVLPLASRLVQVGGQIRSEASNVVSLNRTVQGNEADAYERLCELGMCGDRPKSLVTIVAYDAYTFDGRPLIGFVDDRQQIYSVAAFCGVGYKMSPTVAELVTADLLRRLHDTDLSCSESKLLAAGSPKRIAATRSAW
jgi:glycine/D-amino acid oxidase-like deaminating enzyme